jgi:hypothetical protein
MKSLFSGKGLETFSRVSKTFPPRLSKIGLTGFPSVSHTEDDEQVLSWNVRQRRPLRGEEVTTGAIFAACCMASVRCARISPEFNTGGNTDGYYRIREAGIVLVAGARRGRDGSGEPCRVVARWCQRCLAAGIRILRIARHNSRCRDERPDLCRQASTTGMAGETLHARRLCAD